jgi:hypothetical protein
VNFKRATGLISLLAGILVAIFPGVSIAAGTHVDISEAKALAIYMLHGQRIPTKPAPNTLQEAGSFC